MAANITATTKPRLAPPPGACDTHLHFYDPAHPVAATAHGAPPVGTPAMYRAMQARLGLERLVVVQPSAYGFDNTVTLAAIADFGDCARGVAVIAPTITDTELERLHRGGIRGARFLMFPGGPLGWDALPAMAARVRPLGWHVILQFDGREWPDRAAAIRTIPGDLVIDHIGRFGALPAPDDHAFRAFVDQVERGRTWFKLSAPYHMSRLPKPRFDDVDPLCRALVAAAPERGLWASNWPHPSEAAHPPDDALLLDALLAWAPDDTTRRRILVDNPARLYGFG